MTCMAFAGELGVAAGALVEPLDSAGGGHCRGTIVSEE